MLNTNRGDPRIHRVVTRGLEYSCSATPVHSLTQQRLFVLPSSGGPLLFVRWKGTCTWCVAAILMPCFVLLGQIPSGTVADAWKPSNTWLPFSPPKFLPIKSASSEFFRHTRSLKVNTHFRRENRHRTVRTKFLVGGSFRPALAVRFCTDSSVPWI